MKNRTILSSALLIFVFLLAACGGKAPDAMGNPTEDSMMGKATEPAMTEDTMMATEPAMTNAPTEDAMMHDTPTPDAMMSQDTPTPDAMAKPTAEGMMEAPAWFGTSLKDVRSGDSFTINDFKGKVVLVETMAVWCTTCYQQQTQIKALHESLGMRDDFVSISLDIDPNEDETTLTSYTQENNGFDWQYAVAGADVARAIGNTYGDQFLNPPSAPVLVIDRHGVAHPLPFGVKSAEDLMKAIQPYLDAKM
ncbi:MAG TPA: redoxin family protein [Anaerolineales bacterium]|nr:redoxin family protein [Anaerolineales bacterium]